MTLVVSALPTTPLAKMPEFFNTTVAKGSSRTHSEVIMNGVAYVVGAFNRVIDNSGSSPVTYSITGCAAYNITTGKVLNLFNLQLDGEVHEIALVNGGTDVCIAGEFGHCLGSARAGMAMFNALSGPTDPDTGTLTSGFGNMSISGAVNCMWPNAHGEVQMITNTIFIGGGSGKAPFAKKLKLVSGTWSVDASFAPSNLGGLGPVKGIGALSDFSKVAVGGFITNSLQILNGSDGSTAPCAYHFTPNANQTIIDIACDDTYIGAGGDQGNNIFLVLDWTGSGPRSIPVGTGLKGYDFYCPQGNVQGCSIIYTNTSPSGKLWLLCHHDVVGAPKTSTTAAGFTTHGIVAIQYGANTQNTAVMFANPPLLDGAAPEVLKGWTQTQDRGPDQTYRVAVFGDFTKVNGAARQRYAVFAPDVTGSVVTPPTPHAVTDMIVFTIGTPTTDGSPHWGIRDMFPSPDSGIPDQDQTLYTCTPYDINGTAAVPSAVFLGINDSDRTSLVLQDDGSWQGLVDTPGAAGDSLTMTLRVVT